MSFKQLLTPCSLLLGFMLCAPLAKPGTVIVNGVCYVSVLTCPDVDSVSDPSYDPGPGSVGSSFNFDVTVNGDIYNVVGAYSASYSGNTGSSMTVNDVITYTGNNGATAQADTVTFDVYQDFFDDSCPTCSWAGTYTENIPLILTAPGTIYGQYLYDGLTVGAAGPYGPGTYNYSNSADLDFGGSCVSNTCTGSDYNATLSADYNQVITFSAGTTAGEGATTTPEPAMAIPCGLGLLLVMYGVRRRTHSRIAA